MPSVSPNHNPPTVDHPLEDDTLLGIPSLSSFPTYTWSNRSSSSRTVKFGLHLYDGESQPCTTNDPGSRAIKSRVPDGRGRLLSQDGGNYVEGIFSLGRLQTLSSAQFQRNGKTVYLRVQVDGILLTVDEFDFVARVQLSNGLLQGVAENLEGTLLPAFGTKLLSTCTSNPTSVISHSTMREAEIALENLLASIRSHSGPRGWALNQENLFQLMKIVKLRGQHDLSEVCGSVVSNRHVTRDLKDEFSTFLTPHLNAIQDLSVFPAGLFDSANNSMREEDRQIWERIQTGCRDCVKTHRDTFVRFCEEKGVGIHSGLGEKLLKVLDEANMILAVGEGDVEFFETFHKYSLHLVGGTSLGLLLYNKILEGIIKDLHRQNRTRDSLSDCIPFTNTVFGQVYAIVVRLVDSLACAEIIVEENNAFKFDVKKNRTLPWLQGENDKPLNRAHWYQLWFLFPYLSSHCGGKGPLFLDCYKSSTATKAFFPDCDLERVSMEDDLAFSYMLFSKGVEGIDFFLRRQGNLQESPPPNEFTDLVQQLWSILQTTLPRQSIGDQSWTTQRLVVYLAAVSGRISENPTVLSAQVHCLKTAMGRLTPNQGQELVEALAQFWDVGNNHPSVPHEVYTSYARSLTANTVSTLVPFLRSFNQYLGHLRVLDFAWFEGKKVVVEMRDFLQSVIRCHVKVVNFLLHEKPGWSSNADKYAAAARLLNEIGKIYVNFTPEQLERCVNASAYLTDCTASFEVVSRDSADLSDLNQRCSKLEALFYLMQGGTQMSIQDALEKFEERTKAINSQSADTTFTLSWQRNALESAYDVYKTTFDAFIEQGYNLMSDIPRMRGILNDTAKQMNSEWSNPGATRSQLIAKLLAQLSVAWSLQSTGQVSNAINPRHRIVPHITQILSILRLLGADEDRVKNHLAQVLTGQGKSIVLGLLSAFFACIGWTVHVVCYSSYLASRDDSEFSAFFKLLNVQDKIRYLTFRTMGFDCLTININGSKEKLSTLVEKLLQGTLPTSTSGSLSSTFFEKHVLLVDEVDVFFSPEFYGDTLNALHSIKSDAIARIQQEIWSSVWSNGVRDVGRLVSEAEVKFSSNDPLYSSSKTLLLAQLRKMAEDAIAVTTAEDTSWVRNRFTIDKDGYVAHIEDDGTYDRKMYYGYKNVFNYFRLVKGQQEIKGFDNFGYIAFRSGHVSYAELPKHYPLVLGVTGTLKLSPSEARSVRSYGILTLSSSPTFFGGDINRLDERPVSFHETEESWMEEMARSVNAILKAGRAALVFFAEEHLLNTFKLKLPLVPPDKLKELRGSLDDLENREVIDGAGIQGRVTLAIRFWGRGTDFKSNSIETEKQGGIHVIQSFFSFDQKEEVQIKGRTARKNNKGSYELILCTEHLKEKGINPSSAWSYDAIVRERNKKVLEGGAGQEERLSKAACLHDKTVDFMKRCAKYRMADRPQFLEKYPFVDAEKFRTHF